MQCDSFNLFVCIVVPCLNEELTLSRTCRSLGFGNGAIPPRNTLLILVDNGSTDRTWDVALAIKAASPAGIVRLAEEPEQGYVPPRASGCVCAYEAAKALGWAESTVLIVQGDADTEYSRGYIDHLRTASISEGEGVIIDARVEWPKDRSTNYRGYTSLCDRIDHSFSQGCSSHLDLIVDDKACAYRLSDFRAWGGLLREFGRDAAEIHAETTRMFMRGLTFGARRALCPEAIAWHSMRRIESEPVTSFVTAGFPRGKRFNAAWHKCYPESAALDCAGGVPSPALSLLISARRAHLWGLFVVLPTHVARALGIGEHGSTKATDGVPPRSAEELRSSPGAFLEDVLLCIDERIFRERRSPAAG